MEGRLWCVVTTINNQSTIPTYQCVPYLHENSESISPWQLADYFLRWWDPRQSPDDFEETLAHFWPQWLSCDHCSVNYDAILHMETFDEDFYLLSRVLDLKDSGKVCLFVCLFVESVILWRGILGI